MRDDAAFWFYAAKDRFATLASVIDLDFDGLRQVEDTVHNFATLAGPVINGYAFCDVANQQAIRAKALAWVEANPYRVLFLENVPAVVDDRDAGLADAIQAIRAAAAKETAYLADAGNVAKLKDARAKNEADAKFCWK